jgi:Mce-associated membrane protein
MSEDGAGQPKTPDDQWRPDLRKGGRPLPGGAQPPRSPKAEKLEAKAARLREAEERRAAQAAGGTPPARRGWVVATAVLGVVALALATLLLLTFLAWQDAKDDDGGAGPRDAAVAAAKTFAVDFGSYDYEHLDTEFQEVAERTTPEFAKSYLETSSKLKATFEQYKTQVTARIQGVGVTSSSDSAAVVLVFLDQTVRTSQSSTPRVDRNRLEIHLVNADGTWLVDKLLAK